MPAVTLQRTGELLRKLFEILLAHPEGMKAQDALNALRSQVQLTEYEQGHYESGARFEKIVRFATIDYVKAGWLLKDKGRWLATAQGKDAFEKYQLPEAFHRAAVKLYQEWRANRVVEPPTDDGDEDAREDEKTVAITFEQAEEQAWSEIEQYLRNMNPYEFQKLVASLLRAMGYHVSWIAPPGKDGGIDILAWNDPLGTRPPRIKVQVKREANPIRVQDLRSFMALLGGVMMLVSLSMWVASPRMPKKPLALRRADKLHWSILKSCSSFGSSTQTIWTRMRAIGSR
jgi:restriction system protein